MRKIKKTIQTIKTNTLFLKNLNDFIDFDDLNDEFK